MSSRHLPQTFDAPPEPVQTRDAVRTTGLLQRVDDSSAADRAVADAEAAVLSVSVPTVPAPEPEAPDDVPAGEDWADEALDLAEYNASVAHLSDAELNRGPWQPGDPEGPEPRTMKEWDERAEIMRLAVLSYPGKRTDSGMPLTQGLREYSGIPDIKHKERTEVWRNLGRPPGASSAAEELAGNVG